MSSVYYTKQDLAETYKRLGVGHGEVVYLTGNIGRLGLIQHMDKAEIVAAHFDVIMELLGDSGTLVVPTHSFSLCNSSTPFCMTGTPSETGAFTEYVRTLPNAVRQYHAFSSRSAIGRQAMQICGECSSHAYGYHTPFQKMIASDGIFISIGMPATHSVSLVHQAEFVMGVPYRYTKEFEHPVLLDGKTFLDTFYLFVTHHDVDIDRDKNCRIFGRFSENYHLQHCQFGLSIAQSFRMRDFMESTTLLMRDDIYCWLKKPPVNRPYCL